MKQKDKEALRDWEAHKLSIQQATPVDSTEDFATKKKRIESLKNDYEAFCKYYFPHYCQYDFGDFQHRFFKKAIGSSRAYITNAWSRDHAKSVVTTVLLVAYKWAIGETKNLLLVSHNETNACELLKPLQLEFESNQRLINDFGKQINPGSWEDGKFTTLNGCSFRALGAGQSPRGARNKELRPDTVIVDDIDTEEVCRNPKRLDELWEWVMGALFGCLSIKGKKLFVVVGNIIAKDCIVKRAIARSNYHEQVDILSKGKPDAKYIQSIVDEMKKCKDEQDLKIWKECVAYARAGYRPSWKERFTLFECVYMIQTMGYRLAQREYFNNPLVEGKVFKKEWWQFKKLPPLNQYKFLVAYLDPGFKKSATSDSKCQVLIGLHNGDYHIRKVFCGKASVEEMIEWGYEMDAFVKRNNATYKFKMEEVFLQSLLYKDYAAAGAKKGYQLPVSGDTRKKPDKDARIEAMSGYFERGNVYVDEEIKDDHHFLAFQEQFHNFEPGVRTLKDGPDACEGGFHILRESVKLNNNVTVGNYATNKKRV